MAAAVARFRWRLRLALGAIGRAIQAYVKMLGVAEPWPYLREPAVVRPASLHICFLMAPLPLSSVPRSVLERTPAH